MDEIKVAVLGKEDRIKAALIRNIAKNSIRVQYNGMHKGIDIGFTESNGKKVYLFGASTHERKRFFEEVGPAGIDLGIVIVESDEGISLQDKKVINEVKKQMPCLVFFNDTEEKEFHNFGNIIHGAAEKDASAYELINYLTKSS